MHSPLSYPVLRVLVAAASIGEFYARIENPFDIQRFASNQVFECLSL
jgi:hypothetical protein